MNKEKLNFGFTTARNLLILWGVLGVINACNSDHHSENNDDKKDAKIENSITGTQEKIADTVDLEVLKGKAVEIKKEWNESMELVDELHKETDSIGNQCSKAHEEWENATDEEKLELGPPLRELDRKHREAGIRYLEAFIQAEKIWDDLIEATEASIHKAMELEKNQELELPTS